MGRSRMERAHAETGHAAALKKRVGAADLTIRRPLDLEGVSPTSTICELIPSVFKNQRREP